MFYTCGSYFYVADSILTFNVHLDEFHDEIWLSSCQSNPDLPSLLGTKGERFGLYSKLTTVFLPLSVDDWL
jgi:hypothetical protein